MVLIVLYDPGVYPFLPNVPFWSPWKHKKIKFYDVFREIKREHRKEKSYLENTSNYGFVKTGHFWLWKSEVWVWHLWVLVVRYRYDEKFTGSGLKKFCDKLFKISLVENSISSTFQYAVILSETGVKRCIRNLSILNFPLFAINTLKSHDCRLCSPGLPAIRSNTVTVPLSRRPLIKLLNVI